METLKSLPIKDLNAWFSDLSEIAQKTEDSSSLPKLGLLLRNGNSIRGIIAGVNGSDQNRMLMIASFDDGYNRNEVTFISAYEVAALTLLEPEHYLKQHVIPAQAKAIGGLELKRALKEADEAISGYSAGKITLQTDATSVPEKARWEVLQIAGLLPEILKNLASDELGSKLLYENISSIAIAVSDEKKTALDQKQLKIDIAAPFIGTVTAEKERIQQEIESLL